MLEDIDALLRQTRPLYDTYQEIVQELQDVCDTVTRYTNISQSGTCAKTS